MTEAELAAFLAREFPQVRDDFRIERLTADGIVIVERFRRPADLHGIVTFTPGFHCFQ